ncbi:MAG TPA: formate dehydrogenase subunit delta [Acetobacteraceae bacterium]|nr:formate dehydrogenase subunit delta [Acetobacteraceae bacterium]
MSGDRLVTMANQIGLFFAHRGERAPELIAGHIRQFWDPRMRTAMLAHFAEGGAGLDPLPRAALALLAQRAETRDQAPPAAPR